MIAVGHIPFSSQFHFRNAFLTGPILLLVDGHVFFPMWTARSILFVHSDVDFLAVFAIGKCGRVGCVSTFVTFPFDA